MEFNQFYRNQKKNRLFNYKYLILSFLLVTNFSVNGSCASNKNTNVKESIMSYNFNDIIKPAFDDYTTQFISFINDMRNPSNIDFSDFPYSDGSVESQVNIARYIREKVKNIPNVFKYEYALEHWLFTPNEFDEFYAVIHLEGKPKDGTYELAFANVTNVFNRVISRYKSAIARNKLKVEGPISFYQHITAPSQYSPYGNGDYLDYIGFRDEESYQAVLDALFVMDVMPERMHNYLDFIANGLQDRRPGSVQIVKGGNWFYYPQPESDILPIEERYYYQEEKSLSDYSLKKQIK